MTWWKLLTAKRDGWVERKRRFQKEFAEGFVEASRPKVPAVATAPIPASKASSTNRDRGGK